MTNRDTSARLIRALAVSAAAAGLRIETVPSSTRPWHSATYSGQCHTLGIACDDALVAADWIAGLTDAELPMPDAFVASIDVLGSHEDGAMLLATLAILTILDD